MNEAPEVISQSKFEEVDYSIPKIIVLALASIGASVLAVYEFNQFLTTFQYAFLWFSLGATLAFIVLNILNAFFIKHFSIVWGIALMEAFAPLVLFMQYAKSDAIVILLSAFAFLFLCITFATHAGTRVLRNSVKVRFFEVVRAITPKLMTGILTAACVLVYLTYVSWGGLTNVIGHKLVDGILISAEPGIKLVYPTVSVDQTIDKALRELTVTQISRLPPGAIPNVTFDLSAGLAKLPPADREVVLSKLTGQLKASIEAKIGAFPQGETVKQAAYRLIEDYVKSLSAATLRIMEIVLMVLLFFSLRGLAALTYWFINFFAFIIFKFLIASDFALISYETLSREYVILP